MCACGINGYMPPSLRQVASIHEAAAWSGVARCCTLQQSMPCLQSVRASWLLHWSALGYTQLQQVQASECWVSMYAMQGSVHATHVAQGNSTRGGGPLHAAIAALLPLQMLQMLQCMIDCTFHAPMPQLRLAPCLDCAQWVPRGCHVGAHWVPSCTRRLLSCYREGCAAAWGAVVTTVRYH